MLPITRANLQNFCRACLRELNTPNELNHNINEEISKRNLFPRKICNSCLIKVRALKEFQHRAIIATGVLRLIINEENNDIDDLELKMVCRVCLKNQKNIELNIKNDKKLCNELLHCAGLKIIESDSPTPLFKCNDKDVLNEDPRFPDILCNKCYATLKGFIEFTTITKQTFDYLLSVIAENEDIASTDNTNTKLESNIKDENLNNLETVEQLSDCSVNPNLEEQFTNYECKTKYIDCESALNDIESKISPKPNIEQDLLLDDELSSETEWKNEDNCNLLTPNFISTNKSRERDCKKLSKSIKTDLSSIEKDYNNQQGNENNDNNNIKKIQEKPAIETIQTDPNSQKNSLKIKTFKKLKTTFHCEKCKKTFYKKYMYEAHIKSVHEGIETPFTCPYCHKLFRHVQVLHRHISCSHEIDDENTDIKVKRSKTHLCPFCQRSFKRKDHLKEHVIAVHEGIKSFVCSLCGKAFGTRNTQIRHEKNHSVEKPFSCEFCAKRYNCESELKVHIQRHTTNPELLCPICKRAKPNVEELKKHIEMHSKAFQCTTCGKIFKKMFHLREHESMVHLKLRILKCSYCNETFNVRKTLRNHELSHNSIGRPECCLLCKLNFKSKRALMLHMKKSHSKESTDFKKFEF